jgi:prepilin-type N-terminal cleavage/methylation domain-containing protein
MPKTRGFQKGLTMIEVLVSLVIFLIVLLAIYQLFDTSHATYQSGTRKQDVQQQARLAMDEMVRALRMAGYVSENFDIDPATLLPLTANDMTGTLRVHLGTANALAVYGNLDGSVYNAGPPVNPASAVFLFCWTGTTLSTKRRTDTADAATYTCDNNTTVLADNVTLLRFSYFAQDGTEIPPNLDGKAAGTVLSLAPRQQRDDVRTIAITLQITEQVVQHLPAQTPRQPDQVYTLTSTVRLRNLNNS